MATWLRNGSANLAYTQQSVNNCFSVPGLIDGFYAGTRVTHASPRSSVFLLRHSSKRFLSQEFLMFVRFQLPGSVTLSEYADGCVPLA